MCHHLSPCQSASPLLFATLQLMVRIDSVPSVLMSHFTLNLKELDSKGHTEMVSNPSQLIFQVSSRLVGNIGEQLEIGGSDCNARQEDEINIPNYLMYDNPSMSSIALSFVDVSPIDLYWHNHAHLSDFRFRMMMAMYQ